MPASLGEPGYGLRLDDSFAGIAQCTPSCEVFPISFIVPLPTHGQLLRTVRPLVCAGEVTDEGLLEIQPTVDAAFC